MTQASDVKDFYDRFADSVLLQDFRRLNLRQEAIKQLCRRFVRPGARVLEIGCGVGIIARYLQSFAGDILGVDISERNIEVARAYAENERCKFIMLDVIEEAGGLDGRGPFDAVLLPDVIEHIPKERYRGLFKTIESVLAPSGRVLITHPSPEHQRYLKEHRPEALQVVDETVYLADILDATTLKLLSFEYKDIFCKNQYIHLVLTNDIEYTDIQDAGTGSSWLGYRIRKYLWRWSNAAFVRRVAKPGE